MPGPKVKYTDLLDENIRQSVRQITSGRLEAFRSHIFNGAVEREQIWREARKDPTTGTWTVTHCQAYPQPRNPEKFYVETSCSHGMCFFDALYQVARIEAEGDLYNLKERVEDIPDFITVPHHRASAEKIGIPYDEDGFPLPAVNGAIIIGGRFEPEALAIAARSQGNCAPVAEDVSPYGGLVPVRSKPNYPILASSKFLSTSAHIEKKRKHYEVLLGGEGERIDRANTSWGGESDRVMFGSILGGGTGALTVTSLLMTSGVGPLIIPLMLAGIFGGASAGGYFSTQYMGDVFARRRWTKIKNLAKRFPKGHKVRNEIETFLDEAQLTYSVLKAKNVFNQAAEGKFLAKRRLKSTLRQLDKTFDRVAIHPDNRKRLLSDISNPDRSYFTREMKLNLERRGKDIARLLDHKNIAQIHKIEFQP